jgi:hypothetical protein
MILCLTKIYVMKAYGGVDVKIQVLFTSTLVGVVSFTPLPLYPHCIRGWVDPKADLDDIEK